MSRADVSVSGVRELRREMRKAGRTLEDFKAANEHIAEIVAPVARFRAPRRTGGLATSVEPAKTVGAARLVVKAPYAGPIHWGWPARNITAQPFALEAATETRPVWLASYERDLQGLMTKIERTVQ